MTYRIIDRGRGPEIEGSRITVYVVLDETEAGATPAEMADWFGLDVAQIELALRYISDHRAEVEREWAEIKARHARGNAPEVEAKLAATRAKYGALFDEAKRRTPALGVNGEWPPRGRGTGRLYLP